MTTTTLASNHAHYLATRGVSKEIVEARGYYTVFPHYGPGLPTGSWPQTVREQFAVYEITDDGDTDQMNSALVIPLFDAAGSGAKPALFQLRLDDPRVVDGKAKKFELPAGAERGSGAGSLPVDLHPVARANLLAEGAPIIVTEGTPKGDAILTAGEASGLSVVTAVLTGVAMGVYGPRSKAKSPGSLVEGLVALPLNGRNVYLAFDADWRTNQSVGRELVKLGHALAEAGASVRIIDVPLVNGDPKTGVDDYLAKAGPESLEPLLDNAVTLAAARETIPTADLASGARKKKDAPNPYSGQPLAPLLEALGFEESEAGRWGHPESESEIAGVVRDDEFCVLDRQTAAAIGLPWKRLLDAFGIIRELTGDVALTKRIATAAPTVDELADVVLSNASFEELAELFPSRDALAKRDSAISIAPLIDAFLLNPTMAEVRVIHGVDSQGNPVGAMVGGPNHGFGVETEERDSQGNKRIVWRRLTTWVGYRSAVDRLLVTGADGTPTEAADPTYTVTVVREDGRVFMRPGFSIEDSVNAKKIIDRMDCGVAVPDEPWAKSIVENAFRVLAHANRDETVVLASMGWVTLDGTLTYAAPAGSVTAAGIDQSIVVGPPVGSDENSLPQALALAGFETLPDSQVSLENAFAVIGALGDIAPHRHDVATAIIGAAFSAPLKLARRAAIVLVGPPKIRKSHIASCAQSFFSAQPADGTEFGITIDKARVAPAEALSAWAGDSLFVADDFRLDGDKRANDLAKEIFKGLAQGAYSGASNARGTRMGGVRASVQRRDTVLLSAEVMAAASAITSRVVSIVLDENTVPQYGPDLGPAPLDVFREQHAPHARVLMGAFIQWLAQQVSRETNPLKTMRERSTAVREKYRIALGNDRAGEVVAALATGWYFLREYAKDVGMEHTLPTQEALDKHFASLVGSSVDALAEADPGEQTLRAIGSMLASRQGHLTGSDGNTPPMNELFGWTTDPSGSMSSYRPGGPTLGSLATDGLSVVLSPAALELGQKAAGLGELKSVQIKTAVAKLVKPGTRSGDQNSGFVLRGSLLYRQRCYIIPMAALGIDATAFDDDVAEPASSVAA